MDLLCMYLQKCHAMCDVSFSSTWIYIACGRYFTTSSLLSPVFYRKSALGGSTEDYFSSGFFLSCCAGRISWAMLNWDGNSEDCHHGPNLEGNGSWPLSFVHSPFTIMFVIGLKIALFSLPSLLNFSYLDRFRILLSAFPHLLRWSWDFFWSVNVVNLFYCIVLSFFFIIYWWIQFSNGLFRLSYSCSWVNLSCYLSPNCPWLFDGVRQPH